VSKYDYDVSKSIGELDPPFNAQHIAAMRKADTFNRVRLASVYPAVWEELQARYNAPGGLLPAERAHTEAMGHEIVDAD
jgi:hypothetical protein